MTNIVSSMKIAYTENLDKIDMYETWMENMKLSEGLKKRVRNYHELLWLKFKGLDENQILADLPMTLRGEITENILLDMIQGVEIFVGVDKGFIASFIKKLKFQLLGEGEYVYRRGDIAEEIYFIIEGGAAVLDLDEEKIIDTLKKNDTFGEMEVIQMKAGTRSRSIRAVTNLSLAVMYLDDLREISAHFPLVIEKIQQKIEARQLMNQQRKEEITKETTASLQVIGSLKLKSPDVKPSPPPELQEGRQRMSLFNVGVPKHFETDLQDSKTKANEDASLVDALNNLLTIESNIVPKKKNSPYNSLASTMLNNKANDSINHLQSSDTIPGDENVKRKDSKQSRRGNQQIEEESYENSEFGSELTLDEFIEAYSKLRTPESTKSYLKHFPSPSEYDPFKGRNDIVPSMHNPSNTQYDAMKTETSLLGGDTSINPLLDEGDLKAPVFSFKKSTSDQEENSSLKILVDKPNQNESRNDIKLSFWKDELPTANSDAVRKPDDGQPVGMDREGLVRKFSREMRHFEEIQMEDDNEEDKSPEIRPRKIPRGKIQTKLETFDSFMSSLSKNKAYNRFNEVFKKVRGGLLNIIVL